MLRIGLTGGIGSGKSTVAGMFAKRGVPVIDTDTIAHDLCRHGQPGYSEIVRQFGDGILDGRRRIDRSRLRTLVFDDSAARRRLEAILHPLIREETHRRIENLDAEYCIVVVPLLIETGFGNITDRVLVVDADDAAQIQRVTARNGISEGEIRKIMAAQADRESRRWRADDVISNRTDQAHLETEVDRLHRRYRELARKLDR